jgi:hypothetical protein
MTNADMCKRLESGQNDIVNDLVALPEPVFFAGSDERWSPAHHIAHLAFTHKSVARGFKAKDRLPAYLEASKSYEEMRDSYVRALARATSAGFLQNNPFVAKPEGSKEMVLQTFLQAGQGLREVVAQWSEADLDTKGMKHPLLGLLSAREMLLFMIYHDLHHGHGIQKLIEDGEHGNS